MPNATVSLTGSLRRILHSRLYRNQTSDRKDLSNELVNPYPQNHIHTSIEQVDIIKIPVTNVPILITFQNKINKLFYAVRQKPIKNETAHY